MQEDFPYEDIVNLPHHQSKTRPHMSPLERAAQFSPFAALTGHDEAIKETARLVDGRIELDNDSIEMLNGRLQYIQDSISAHPQVNFTYYKPDEKKAGGAYIQTSGTVKKIDMYEKAVILDNGVKIRIDDVIGIAGEIFGDEGYNYD